MGQYHQPRQEERIFLFLDMKSSTTIAEKIGNEQYFRLLHDVFSDIAESIAEFEGEIYLTRAGKSSRRLTALLHSDKDFLAMTDVTVCDRAGSPVHKAPFLQVNIKHIETLWPSDPAAF
jgi:class 3 adenylate cyclase